MEKFEASIFDSTEEMRDKIIQVLKAKKYVTDLDEVQFGYIIPGHGFKGKQHALESDNNVIEMYDAYKGRKSSVGEDQSCSSKAPLGIIRQF